MNTQKQKTLKELKDAADRGWARVSGIIWKRASMFLVFAIDAVRNGETLEGWNIECKNVIEYKVVDVNGGGLTFYDSEHPLVRQYRDDVVELRFQGSGKRPRRLMGDLACVHEKVVGDWIAFDAYLGNVSGLVDRLELGKGRLAQGPKFLMNCYADVLRENGLKARLVAQTTPAHRRATAIHFGNSYVVARSIRAERIADESEL